MELLKLNLSQLRDISILKDLGFPDINPDYTKSCEPKGLNEKGLYNYIETFCVTDYYKIFLIKRTIIHEEYLDHERAIKKAVLQQLFLDDPGLVNLVDKLVTPLSALYLTPEEEEANMKIAQRIAEYTNIVDIFDIHQHKASVITIRNSTEVLRDLGVRSSEAIKISNAILLKYFLNLHPSSNIDIFSLAKEIKLSSPP
jgi:hypothetical protein